jgi:hypothetical protein
MASAEIEWEDGREPTAKLPSRGSGARGLAVSPLRARDATAIGCCIPGVALCNRGLGITMVLSDGALDDGF